MFLIIQVKKYKSSGQIRRPVSSNKVQNDGRNVVGGSKLQCQKFEGDIADRTLKLRSYQWWLKWWQTRFPPTRLRKYSLQCPQPSLIAPPQVRSVTWNGRTVSLDSDAGSSVTTIGGLVGLLTPRVTSSSVKVPTLTNWKFSDSLPEIQSNFSDDSWTIANHTTTNSPFPMNYGDGRILYGCDYGL